MAAELPAGVHRVAVSTGIEIAYESFGNETDPAILLIMGLGAQMVAWPVSLCEQLADAGHRVIRFDNRDVGLSTHIDAPVPTLADFARRRAAYDISDMADDAVGLLDALGVPAAHVVGASMGGFISQTIALHHAERVLSLTLIMTSTGSPLVGHTMPKVIMHHLRKGDVRTVEEAVDAAFALHGVTGSQGHLNEPALTELASESYRRSHDPGGVQRQLAACLRQRNRTRDLRKISVPTRVIHGLADPLVNASGGLAVAKAIPGATFIGHAGMGHDLPRTIWPLLVEDILAMTQRVDRGDTAAGSVAS